MTGAVLPWKEQIFRLQLQFVSLCFVGINCCNITSFLYLRCHGARDSNQDPLANRIARIESRDLKKPKLRRNGQSTVGGPKWTKMDLSRPKWTILLYYGLANAKIQFGIRPF